MNAVRTPSIVLLFHSYMFQDVLSSFPARSLLERFDTIRGTRIFRDVSPTLSRLRSTGWWKKILRGSFCMQLKRSRTFDDHFLFINHRSFDPLEFLESFLFVTDVTLQFPRNIRGVFVPRKTLEKGVLVNRTFRRFVSRSRNKVFEGREAWKQAARRIVVLGDFTKPDNGAI